MEVFYCLYLIICNTLFCLEQRYLCGGRYYSSKLFSISFYLVTILTTTLFFFLSFFAVAYILRNLPDRFYSNAIILNSIFRVLSLTKSEIANLIFIDSFHLEEGFFGGR